MAEKLERKKGQMDIHSDKEYKLINYEDKVVWPWKSPLFWARGTFPFPCPMSAPRFRRVIAALTHVGAFRGPFIVHMVIGTTRLSNGKGNL